jgi:lipopolysaccharide export system permease protein
MFFNTTVYIFRLLSWPLLLITFCLTSIIWLTQALRFIDFIINRGLGVLDFLYITLLLVPALLMIVLPVALFIATIFCYNKLMTDSELIVMEASGLSPWQLAKPVMLLGILTMLVAFAISLYFLPAANRQFKDMQSFLRDNYASVLLQEEVFNHPVDGLTVFIRDRNDEGLLEGIIVHDNRVEGESVTMLAEEAQLIQTASGPRFLLKNGMRQEERQGRINWLDFASYNLDLSFYTEQGGQRIPDAKERFIHDLLDPKDVTDAKERMKFRAEAHQRLTWPIYTLGLPMLAVAVLLKANFNRRGRWKRITGLVGVSLAIVLASFGLSNLVTRLPFLIPLLYTNAFAVPVAAWWILLMDKKMSATGAMSPGGHTESAAAGGA